MRTLRWIPLMLLAMISSAAAGEPRDPSRYRNLQVGDGGYFGPYHRYPVAAPPGRGFTSNLGVGIGPSYIDGLGTSYPREILEIPSERPSLRQRLRNR